MAMELWQLGAAELAGRIARGRSRGGGGGRAHRAHRGGRDAIAQRGD